MPLWNWACEPDGDAQHHPHGVSAAVGDHLPHSRATVGENFGRPLAEATVMASGAQGARAAKHLPPHPPVRFFRTCIPVIACGTVAARSRNQRLFWS